VSEELARLLDLRTAWRRIKRDIHDRVFIRHPYAVSMVELDLEGWLQHRLSAIQSDHYSPSPMFVCDVPKGKGLIRPGSHLSYSDRLIFTACVGACFPAIHQRLLWSQGIVDFSYRLAPDPENPDWLKDRFIGWKDFQDRSIQAIDARISHVVIADIASFYENIDIGLLVSDLKDAHAPLPAVEQIAECLNRWAQAPGRGIPQGQSASDILAKLYVDNIDHILKDMGYLHLRYVDDMRIFCRSHIEAKKVLIDLSRLLRKRGLSLQAAKSEIYDFDVARRQIEEVTAAVREVKQTFIRDVINQTGIGDPYMSVREADEILDENPDEAPLEVIEEAYRTYVMENRNNFNATLFRFLLNRLGKQRDSFAAPHCLALLEPYPEETPNILRYLRSIGPGAEIESQIVDLMNSGEMVYQYQSYEIIEWFYERSTNPSGPLVELVRQICFDQSSPRYLKTICRAFLGKFGVSADIERIASTYDETNDPSERAEIICSIRRMEHGRRNSFLARVERDGGENVRAVRWVRSQA
jgi:hypothetical protein